jgi:hypothetical protein
MPHGRPVVGVKCGGSRAASRTARFSPRMVASSAGDQTGVLEPIHRVRLIDSLARRAVIEPENVVV